MVADCESFLDQILSIKQDAPGVAAGLSDEAFSRRPAPDRWSIGEAFEHLNLSAARVLPKIDAAIDEGRAAGRLGEGPFSYGFVERWITRSLEPPPRRRSRAPASLVPSSGPLSRETVMGRFLELQEAIAARVRHANGVDLRRTKVRGALGPLSLSLGQMFQLLLAHERRHVWQARQVRNALDGVGER